MPPIWIVAKGDTRSLPLGRDGADIYLGGSSPAAGDVLIADGAYGADWGPIVVPAGSVVDAMVSASAAIAWTKISKVGALPADIGAAAATHTHAASDIASGTIATARLGSGTANSTTFLRGDQTWPRLQAGAGRLCRRPRTKRAPPTQLSLSIPPLDSRHPRQASTLSGSWRSSRSQTRPWTTSTT